MSRATFRLLMLLLSLLAAGAVAAAPPATLGYQGRLASAGGIPVSATLSITFRLYDVPSGGSALWTETQPAVDVDGGNLAVELGSVTPLPSSIWGRQLYLGVQVAGDSEMLPRPALTASPYALRAAATMKRTLVVSAEGTPAENGAALLAAVASIADASAATPVAVELDAGTFDLGANQLLVPSYVELIGRGQLATLITSSASTADPSAAVRLASHTAARDFTARNTGVPTVATTSVVGLAARGTVDVMLPVENVRVQRVTGESIAPTGSNGQRAGLNFCASFSHFEQVTGNAEGGQFAMGMRADCALSEQNFIDGVLLNVRGASDGLRGTYLAGGGPWNNIRVFIDASPSVQNIFGIRIFANSTDDGAMLSDAGVSINGTDLVSAVSTGNIDGVRVDYGAAIDFKDLVVNLENVKAAIVAGVRIVGDAGSPHVVRLTDLDVRLRGVQAAATGPGGLYGVFANGALLQVEDARIHLDCLAPGFNRCVGIQRAQPPGPPGTPSTVLQAGTSVLDQVRIEVGHVDPADGSATSFAYDGQGPARIENSSLRVHRSADGEFATVLNVADASNALRVHQSVLALEQAADPNNGCLLAGVSGANVEWASLHVQGQTCAGGTVTVSCAGITRRGSGFLAASCP
jgi:hypothetical protein